MKVLITGAAGQLGQDLQKLLEAEGIEYIPTDFAQGYTKLDISNLSEIGYVKLCISLCKVCWYVFYTFCLK